MRSFSEKTMNSDPGDDLVAFAARFLETRGAALETNDGGLEAVLPERVSGLLGTPEYVRIHGEIGDTTDDGYSIHYGSPLVDRMVEAVCSEVPLLFCDLRFDYLKSDGFDRLIREQFHLHDMSGRVQSSAKVKTEYLVLSCRYTAQSDEQKEGLINLTFNYETGALISPMADMLSPADKSFRSESKIIRDQRQIKKILTQVQTRSKEIIMEEIASFRESMIRRFKRDSAHLEAYFEAMEKEMKSSLERQGLSDDLIRDRKEKIASLPHELERKKDDLLKKYSIKIRIVPCAMLFIRTPAVKILCSLSKPGKNRHFSFIYNPVGKSIDPLVCEGCGKSITDLYSCHDFHLLCQECGKKCPVCA
jgi:hypothetical protein